MKNLIITGAHGSLGKVLETTFLNFDWKVEAASHHELDVTNSTAIRKYFKSRQLDLLVCAAGITRDAPLVCMQENQWNDVLAVNYKGAADCAVAVLPEMIQQGHGHIVFISSYSALHPAVGQAAYAASKAALLGLTVDLAAKYGSYNIRVNTVLPGFIETKMTETVSALRKVQILSEHSLRRFNTLTAVAKFILHLHEDLLCTSGQVFQLDSRIS